MKSESVLRCLSIVPRAESKHPVWFVICGFNIAIILVLLDVVTAPLFPRRTAALLVINLISLYTVLVGAGASVVRAAVMGATYLIGFRLLGRPTMAVAGLFTVVP